MPKYENAVVYQLCCDDPEITDIYVGSTCNFKVRKWKHKSNCTNENSKEYDRYVYQYIRENGGWDAWSMILVKKYPHVADNQELLMKERKWITRLKATLNKQIPGTLKELGKTEYHKKYREQNKNKMDDYQKQYRKQNKTKQYGYIKAYRERNKNEIDEYQKQYREQNKTKMRDYQKLYREQKKNQLVCV